MMQWGEPEEGVPLPGPASSRCSVWAAIGAGCHGQLHEHHHDGGRPGLPPQRPEERGDMPPAPRAAPAPRWGPRGGRNPPGWATTCYSPPHPIPAEPLILQICVNGACEALGWVLSAPASLDLAASLALGTSITFLVCCILAAVLFRWRWNKRRGECRAGRAL